MLKFPWSGYKRLSVGADGDGDGCEPRGGPWAPSVRLVFLFFFAEDSVIRCMTLWLLELSSLRRTSL